MRPWMLVVLAIVLGLSSGLGLTVIELGASPAGTVQADLLSSGDKAIKGPRPKIVVDKDEYDFGTMEHDTSLSHTFTVRNEGEKTLKLTSGGVSCSHCTSFTIAKAELAPGESTTVEVTWKGINGGKFRQNALLNTNDPVRGSVSLTINGKVLSTYRVHPEEVVFSNLAVTDTPTAEVQIFSYHGAGLEVTEHELTDKETADNFGVVIQPMSAGELAAEPDAKSGVVVKVSVKSGLPLGLIRQKIRLRLNLPDSPVVEVPIEGNVTSDLQVIGRENWDADHNVLNFGPVSSREGAKEELFLHARGPHRHELKPKVRQATPEWLKVTVGQATDLGGGELVRVPITVEVPSGSPAGLHLGHQQGDLGDVLIETGDPDAKLLRLRVRFAVGE